MSKVGTGEADADIMGEYSHILHPSIGLGELLALLLLATLFHQTVDCLNHIAGQDKMAGKKNSENKHGYPFCDHLLYKLNCSGCLDF
jgi:hypothetical protein